MSKRANPETAVDWMDLTNKTLEKIESVLSRDASLDDVANWAIQEIRTLEVPARHAYLRVAWLSLAASPQWKPADAEFELRKMAAVFRGDSDYKLTFRYVPEEKLRKILPASSFAPIDLTTD